MINNRTAFLATKEDDEHYNRMVEFIRPYYNEPHRHYHDYNHIGEMISTGRSAFGLNDVQEYAIMFHDIVYDPKSNVNEVLSVQKMYEFFASESKNHGYHVSPMTQNKAELIIMDTIKHFYPSSYESAVVLDLDLMRLGYSFGNMDRHSEAIRKEFAHLSNLDYERGRKKFYLSVLELDYIYSTLLGRQLWEYNARSNILESLRYVQLIHKDYTKDLPFYK